MDVQPYLDELTPAPRAVFEHLPERRSRVRFMLDDGRGDWTAVTWQAFADQIRHLGQYFLHRGIEPGDRIAIYAPNSVPWLSAALAAQAIGAVMVPIYGSSTADQVAYVLNHSGARLLATDTPTLLRRALTAWPDCDRLEHVLTLSSDAAPLATVTDMHADGQGDVSFRRLESGLTELDDALAIGRALDDQHPRRFDDALDALSLDDPTLMLYTSGTTGPPKGVPLTHRNVATNGRDWMTINGPQIDDHPVDLLWLPFSHVFGFGEACLGNTLGFTTYLSDPRRVLDQLPTVRPSVFMSVPRYFEKLVEAAADIADDRPQRLEALQRLTGGNLCFCLSGGAGLSREVKDLFYDAGMLIIEGYGLTEASPTLTLNRPDDFDFDTVGKPLPSVDLQLADDGEILARGDSIFHGYHNNPQATEKTFTDDGWLKTGDLGRWTDDGFLQIIGRKKDILVTAAGKNISPKKIEARFADDPTIAHLVVYGDGKKYLTAGLWPNAGALEDPELLDDPQALQDFYETRVQAVNDTLASYETLKKIAVFPDRPLTVENGLLTPTLKVKRPRVYDAFGDDLDALYQEDS